MLPSKSKEREHCKAAKRQTQHMHWSKTSHKGLTLTMMQELKKMRRMHAKARRGGDT